MGNTVTDNDAASRFEITVDGELAGYLDYREHQGEYALPHTRVLTQFEGRGIGSELVVSALETIRERGGTVLPYCPFVPKVMRDHPELIDLVPEDERGTFGLDVTQRAR
ncbi:GNAT family N-acetyltransferase [Aeromicrobium terrae]|uniref:N-acetyltransferase n=1 Tax=Aeromicrobium terrae TaxID=2498846 RepID=A0A5C8NQP7_9ACTN|nr:GNAT family N-acetyltransferase [Aeromicrobium terrae]TXL62723.1 N-acetyltransferase [Aeromicrobium terrae]